MLPHTNQIMRGVPHLDKLANNYLELKENLFDYFNFFTVLISSIARRADEVVPRLPAGPRRLKDEVDVPPVGLTIAGCSSGRTGKGSTRLGTAGAIGNAAPPPLPPPILPKRAASVGGVLTRKELARKDGKKESEGDSRGRRGLGLGFGAGKVESVDKPPVAREARSSPEAGG
ncbi:uncharacterized protein A4U43_C01F9740 [Asparagus officinalis]|uniref:Uncharacterized protein n=1 Tax=Asparagus officinalis TaxID=4686 RepID=A0A5P1FN70_ASPOF|nr:uncharacterized protein A4U43_C01F9740 [Asparagus officinalis]